MPDLASSLREFGKWLGFIGSLLTVLLGCIHIFIIGAEIHWPAPPVKAHFTDDTQKVTWREPMFSLNPIVLTEVWTPLVVGLIGVLAHFRDFVKLKGITQNFTNYFFFNLFQGLFATIAYNGGLGVIFSIPVFLSAFFCAMSLFVDDGNACLGFNWRLPGR